MPNLRRRLTDLTIMWAFPVIVGCSTPAPSLPSDTTSTNRQSSLTASDFSVSDLGLSCTSIKNEYQRNKAKIETNNTLINANRQQNQVAGYFGALLLVPLVATEANATQKNEITLLHQRKDVLVKLAGFKKCDL